jgi:hypothetical protein
MFLCIFDAKACSEKMYCVQKHDLIYISYADLVIINLKEKFSQNKIKFPANLIDAVKGKACSLKCSANQISLLAGEKEYFLKITKKSTIEILAEKSGPGPNMSEKRLGIGADAQNPEIFSDSSIKVEIEVIKTEARKEFRGKPFREDTYETLVIKKDKSTNKKIDEISVFKDTLDIH